jgi:hypothetical protein
MRSALTTITAVLVVVCVMGVGTMASSRASDRPRDDEQMAQLSQELESIAADLSVLLAETAYRPFLSPHVEAAGKRNAMVLRDALASTVSQGRESADERIFGLATKVQRAETMLVDLGFALPRLDLLLPDEGDRGTLERADTIYVAVAPLQDESVVASVTAYANGTPVRLRADEPPTVPTLVLAPAEAESLDPSYPLPVLDQPAEEEHAERRVDDYVGIPQILITNDHEPWYRGDPEIYVHFRRWLVPSGVFVDTRRDLAGVNDENRWYFLGDPNLTYHYVDAGYHRFIEIIVYESDGWDDDDVVGVFIPDWRTLSFGGYTEGTPLGTTKHARLYLDRD